MSPIRTDILKIILIISSVVPFLCVACGRANKTVRGETEEKNIQPVPRDLTSVAAEMADSILAELTLEEKVGQCLMPAILSNSDETTLELFRKYIEDYHVGGIVLLKGDLKSAETLARLGNEAKIPLFVAIDAEWGLGMRLKDAPVYPKNGNIDKDSDESELYDYGRRIAEESRRVGINMVLGPVVDITSSTKGVIGRRSFGSDPQLVSEFGVAYAKGLESGGVVSVAKHFPGHGSARNDSHKGVARLETGISLLDSLDLRPFREYINAGLSGVMAGHLQSLALDPDGNPASVSMDILTSLLREELGFKGLILTDAFDMGGAKGFEAADALKAGADLVLCPSDLAKEYQNIIEEIKRGELNISLINDRCRRVLFTKALFIYSFPESL